MPTILNDFLRRLRERAKPGVSLTKVALQLDVKKEYLSRVELGLQRAPSDAAIAAMMDVYQCGPGLRGACKILQELSSAGRLHDDGFSPVGDGIRIWERLRQEPELDLWSSYGNRLPVPRESDAGKTLYHVPPILNNLLHLGTWIHEVSLYGELLKRLRDRPETYRLRKLDLEGATNTFAGLNSSFRIPTIDPFVAIFKGLMCFEEAADGMLASSDAERLKWAEESFADDFEDSYSPEHAVAIMETLREHAAALRAAISLSVGK